MSLKFFKLLFFVFVWINIVFLFEIPQKQLFYNLKLISFVLIVLYMILIRSKTKIHTPSINTSNKLVFIAVLIWCFFMLPSLLSFLTVGASFLLFSFILLGYFAFILIGSKFNNVENYMKFNKIWLFPIISALILAIILSLVGYTDKYYISNEGRLRYTFSFSNPNALGSLCYIVILVYLKLIILKNVKWYSATSIIMLSLIGFILSLTDSRTPFYTILIFLLSYLILKSAKKVQLNLRITYYCFLSILFFLLSVIVVNNFNYNTVDELLSSRLANWSLLLNTFSGSDWFVGKGLGIVAEDLIILQTRSITFDNFFFSIFVQSGYLGIIGLLVFIVVLLIRINKIKDTKLKNIAIASTVSWLAFAFFETAFFSVGNLVSIYIWTDLGIILAIKQSN